MLWSEFIDGTGCKISDHNYQVYKDLEIMYSNSGMTKEQIYEYGKKLVDNSKSAEQIALEEQIKAEIVENKREMESYKECIKREKEFAQAIGRAANKDLLKHYRQMVKYHKNRITGLRWVLGS